MDDAFNRLRQAAYHARMMARVSDPHPQEEYRLFMPVDTIDSVWAIFNGLRASADMQWMLTPTQNLPSPAFDTFGRLHFTIKVEGVIVTVRSIERRIFARAPTVVRNEDGTITTEWETYAPL